MEPTIQLLAQQIELGFKRVDEKFEELIENHLDPIKQRVEKTNGRVGKLEIWRSAILGGLAVTNAILVPITLMVISRLIEGYGK